VFYCCIFIQVHAKILQVILRFYQIIALSIILKCQVYKEVVEEILVSALVGLSTCLFLVKTPLILTPEFDISIVSVPIIIMSSQDLTFSVFKNYLFIIYFFILCC